VRIKLGVYTHVTLTDQIVDVFPVPRNTSKRLMRRSAIPGLASRQGFDSPCDTTPAGIPCKRHQSDWRSDDDAAKFSRRCPIRLIGSFFSRHYDSLGGTTVQKRIIHTFAEIGIFYTHGIIFLKSFIVIPNTIFFVFVSENLHGQKSLSRT